MNNKRKIKKKKKHTCTTSTIPALYMGKKTIMRALPIKDLESNGRITVGE
jgi:hypothetical protein